MKRMLISPYFGRLPNYFQLFLDSCELNDGFTDFLVVTDDQTRYRVPANVQVVNMSFADFNQLVTHKLGFEFPVTSPYKICDYRPAFGKIFEDYLKGYDFWGHVDTDMILGNLSNFLSPDVFEQFDRLLERGALMFYRNTASINELFSEKIDGIVNFGDAVRTKEPCFYDEIMFPALLKHRGYKTYSNTRYADILPQYFDFTIDAHCDIENQPQQYFVYKQGVGVFQGVGDNENVNECMYVHIQKRPMEVGAYESSTVVYLQENSISAKRSDSRITKEARRAWRFNYLKKQLNKLDWNHIRIHLRTRMVRRRIEW
ncbi:hypothetical protein EYC58_00370 [Candidatus Saccharibacteria bacterium]|nr:MAG: hypothetical protein EYC58_00370 [Candidatus Saccharibacteria bacterium]